MSKKVKPPSEAEILALFGRAEPFKSLPLRDRKRLCRAAVPVQCRRKEVLFIEGHSAKHAWVLFSGRIGIMVCSRAGRRQELEHIVPGEIFGTLTRMFSHVTDYPCTAEATIESVALRIPDEVFKSVFSGDVRLMTLLCGLLADRLAKMMQLPRLSMEPPRTRVAFAISRLTAVYGNTIPVKEREIADLAGVAPETAYRTLHDFRESKLISSEPHHVVVLDADKMHELWREDGRSG
jgi:CRP-like cAMP-binding protein